MSADLVVLLHGLARTHRSMKQLGAAFDSAGYRVFNCGYPSRRLPVRSLSDHVLHRVHDVMSDAGRVHFVTHSLGGILVRDLLQRQCFDAVGRVVMLGPPNRGSEVVDAWRRVPGFRWLNGPAGLELGTDQGSVPRALGPVAGEVGVIAGTRSVNPWLSRSLPGPGDGKVSVSATRVDGMTDHLEVPVSHPFLMRHPEVIRQAVTFVRSGAFDRSHQ